MPGLQAFFDPAEPAANLEKSLPDVPPTTLADVREHIHRFIPSLTDMHIDGTEAGQQRLHIRWREATPSSAVRAVDDWIATRL